MKIYWMVRIRFLIMYGMWLEADTIFSLGRFGKTSLRSVRIATEPMFLTTDFAIG